MSDHDHPYKLLFSHTEMVRDLLLTFVREDWVRHVDFTTLERHAGSFVTDDLREREDDIIWSVRWGERRLYIYLLIEFQASSDRFMAVRMMTYLGLLYQDLVRTKQIRHDDPLPAVLPLVLYNGKPRWTAPLDIGDLIQKVPGGLQRYRPTLRYLLIDETHGDDRRLPSINNAVAALFRLERSSDPAEVRAVLRDLIGWLRAPQQTRLRRDFTVWFARTFLPGRAPGHEFPEFNDLQEVDAMLSETVIEWTKKWKEEGLAAGRAEGLAAGRAEGLAEGRAEGEHVKARELADKLLTRAFSVVEVAELTGLPVEEVEKLGKTSVSEPAAEYCAKPRTGKRGTDRKK